MTTRHSSTVTVDQDRLPFWPQDLRGVPNAFARSALFCVANARKGERKLLRRRPIAALKGITITYTGDELRQDDEDVFLQILHLARGQELGEEVCFTAYQMIVELGWTKNSGSYNRLIECLERMVASAIAVTVASSDGQMRENYTGSLIRSFRWRETGSDSPMREWRVLMEKEIVTLFSPHCYSRLDWKMRMKLAPLEKWLHSFYHTHQKPFPFSVKLLHELTGSEIPASELRKFRYKLKLALASLVEIGFFKYASIDPRLDLVMVERNLEHQSIVQR